jgi:hypothetical protein
MEISSKEKAFASAYEELLERFGVALVIETSSDEHGRYAVLIFKEQGKYCNISYVPEYKEDDRGYHGMGG